MKKLIKPNTVRSCVMGATLMLAATAWGAQDVYLRAEKFTKTLPGGVKVVMWGFAQDTGPGVLDATTTNSPGPAITVAATEATLNIHLLNNLPEPVSIVIPGQKAVLGDVQRVGNRVQSFTKVAAANGGSQTYTWPDLKPGTYLYHSGSHPALQVQMGLYGAVKKDAATGQAYPGVAYAKDVTLLFSEIDVDVHNAVAAGNFKPQPDPAKPDPSIISSMIDSIPEYFLINGEPYAPGQEPLPAGFAGQTVLLRLLNAGSDDRVPVLSSGDYLQVIAEDGNVYSYPKSHYAVQLSALKTRDALLKPAAGELTVYDRRLGLSNGGMYVKLNVAP